jgi:hypothetical protein
MESTSKVFWVTRTGVLIAMLIGWQAVSSVAGNQLITGSGVNFILIISVMMSGLPSGIIVAAVSPVMARFFGIGPAFAALIPFTITGNVVLVLLWHYIAAAQTYRRYTYIAAVLAAAVAKFTVLYFGVAKLAIPIILKLPEKQAAIMTSMFSLPQLITAATGGILAAMVLQIIIKAVKR